MDGLPAGLEPRLWDPSGNSSGGWRSWFEHTNVRDEGVEAFASVVPAGEWTVYYWARATTKGTFIAAPAHAEEMYSPETFGRGAAERVVIE